MEKGSPSNREANDKGSAKETVPDFLKFSSKKKRDDPNQGDSTSSEDEDSSPLGLTDFYGNNFYGSQARLKAQFEGIRAPKWLQGPSPREPRHYYIVKGIRNREGTCFLSSVLQCLLSIDAMRERYGGTLLLNFGREADDGTMTHIIRRLFAERCVEGPPHQWRRLSPFDSSYEEGSKVRDHNPSSSLALKTFLLENSHGLFLNEKGGECPAWVFNAIFQFLNAEEEPSEAVPCGLPLEMSRTFMNRTFLVGYVTRETREDESLYMPGYQFERQHWEPYIRIYRIPNEGAEEKYSISELLSYTVFDDDEAENAPSTMEYYTADDPYTKEYCTSYLPPAVEFKLKRAPEVLIINIHPFKDSPMDDDRHIARMTIEHTLDLTPFVDAEDLDSIGVCRYRLIAAIPYYSKEFTGLTTHVMACVRSSKYPTADTGYYPWILFDDTTLSLTRFTSIIDEQHLLFFRTLVYERESNFRPEFGEPL